MKNTQKKGKGVIVKIVAILAALGILLTALVPLLGMIDSF